jgi:hypothetical protein
MRTFITAIGILGCLFWISCDQVACAFMPDPEPEKEQVVDTTKVNQDSLAIEPSKQNNLAS